MNYVSIMFISLQLWFCMSFIGLARAKHPLKAAGKWSFREPSESTVWLLPSQKISQTPQPSPFRFSLTFSPDLKSSVYKGSDNRVRRALRTKNKVVVGLYRKSWFSFRPVFEQLMAFDELNEFSYLKLDDYMSDRVKKARLPKIKSGTYVLKAYIKSVFGKKSYLTMSKKFHIRKIGIQDEVSSTNVIANATFAVKPETKYKDANGLSLRVQLGRVLKKGKQIQFTLFHFNTTQKASESVYIKAGQSFSNHTNLKLSMNMPSEEGAYQLIASIRDWKTMFSWTPIFITAPEYLIATNFTTSPVNTAWLHQRAAKLEPITEDPQDPDKHLSNFNERHKKDTGYENRPGRGMDPLIIQQLSIRQYRRRHGKPPRSDGVPLPFVPPKPPPKKKKSAPSPSKDVKVRRNVRFADQLVQYSDYNAPSNSYYQGPSTAELNDYSSILGDDEHHQHLYYPSTESQITVTPLLSMSVSSFSSLTSAYRESSLTGVPSHPIEMSSSPPSL